MHVLKEDQEGLSNQLKVPACHGCIHLETQSDDNAEIGLTLSVLYRVFSTLVYLD